MSRDRDDDRGRSRSRDDRDDDRGSRRSSRDDDGGRDRGRDRGRDDDRGGRNSSRYEYRPRDRADVTKRSEARGAGDFDRILSDAVKMWSAASGNNCFRPLPPTWEGAKHYGLDIFVHYGVGPDRATYLCLQKMKGEPCPICEERARVLRNDPSKDDEEYAKQLEPKARVLIYLVDRESEKDGVQAWAMPWGLDKDYCTLSEDKRTREIYEIDNPESGYDLEFRKSGEGKKTKYESPALSRRSSPLGKSEWLDFAVDNPLPSMLVYYDYDHIKRAFDGGGGQRSDRDGDSRDRGRGRDDDRGRDDRSRDSRDREEPRGRDRDRDEGSRDRDRDRGRDDDRGGRSSRDEPTLTWASIHEMTKRELEDLIDDQKLNVNPREAKDDDDLADWICEEMGLKKEERASRSSSSRDERPDDRGREERTSRLDEMRRRRVE
jgi:hypothetical protein